MGKQEKTGKKRHAEENIFRWKKKAALMGWFATARAEVVERRDGAACRAGPHRPTSDEAAEVLGISSRTADREWELARAFTVLEENMFPCK